ncbi:MAG TPA: DUF354 domain-containing protein [Pyrinomonadaceae bacterium]|nr:DUF354 domain-containing protein [Pyrinomonadaceae bacterium]
MRIWIDLANSPHVPLFSALIKEFAGRGHEVEITARDFAETVDLARAAGLEPQVIGKHGGRGVIGKTVNLFQRAWALRRWARGRFFDLAVSHNSYTQILAARWLGLKSVTLMDYEHQPANHLAFRFASRIIVPSAFPEDALIRHGADLTKVRRYNGAKEDVYLADFERDPNFIDKLRELGVSEEAVLVTVRPPARDALYHRFENELFDELLNRLLERSEVKVVLLPRTASQRSGQWLGQYRNAIASGQDRTAVASGLIIPAKPLDGPNLIAASDLLISAGGTMNREAAALGIPAATIYAGQWAAIDEKLVREGRLMRIHTRQDLDELPIKKKTKVQAHSAAHVRREVTELILEQ